ncbi:MAG: ABC transporter substrate-binding protein [Flavobacteriales bacterium]|nr:ABC transporter substrate-binding protein [Flavobacteriales bacterium]
MKILKYTYLLFLGLLLSCNDTNKDNENLDFGTIREANGFYQEGDKKFKLYTGGVFRLNETGNLKNLFPPSINHAISSRIALQIYQGLVKLNQRTLKVENLLAKSIEMNEEGTLYTFNLIDSVYFQDDACFESGKGRKLTANDFKFCYDLICSDVEGNRSSNIFLDRIVGARAHFESTSNGNFPEEGVSGISVIDEHTLQINLTQPCSFFLKILSHAQCVVYPKEAYEKYGMEMRTQTVGTGPFMLDNMIEGNELRLVRNQNYWESDEHGNSLPYLDVIKMTFNSDKKIELTNFKKSNLDMVYQIPVDQLQEVLVSLDSAKSGGNPEFQYQSKKNGLSSVFYCFNMEKPIFKDIRVRKALNMAVDREKITKYSLQGETAEALSGLVPTVGNYDNSNVKGFDYNPEMAQELLAEAGYPGGEGFPNLVLEISENNYLNPIVAEAIQSMLKENLGVQIKIDYTSLTVLIERFTNGISDLWGSIWIADYPDPQNFLQLFDGSTVPKNTVDENGEVVLEPSYTNPSRYKNDDFDYFYSKAVSAISDEVAIENYYKADSVLVADAAFMPIYYEHYIRLLQNNVHGFPQNALEYRDFTRVFLSKK